MTTQIIGTGSCLPKTAVNNDFLSTIIDTSDEWIRSRTGIRERRLVKEKTLSQMCVEAARNALADAGMSATEVNLILVGTLSRDYVTPSTACQVQARLGAVNAVAVDLNAACSGFLFALHTAHAYLQAGFYRNALVLGGEVLSKLMAWTDRSTCVLFGDGAGAAVVTRGERGLIAFEQGLDGSKGTVLSCRGRGICNPLVRSQETGDKSYVHMDGQAVYCFAVTTVPASILRILGKASLKPEDVDYFVLHQANIRILQSVAKKLNQPEGKFPVSLDHCGNISAGSVPVLLDEMNRRRMLKPGMKLVLSGFGGGLTWGTALIEWQKA